MNWLSHQVIATGLVCTLAGCQSPQAESQFRSIDDIAIDGGVVGTYEAYVARGHDGSSWMIHKVNVDGDKTVLEFGSDPPLIEPGSLVQIFGDGDSDSIDVDSFEVVSPPPPALIDADPFTPRQLATIVLHFGTPEFDTLDIEDRMFTGDESSRAYFSEISYGKEDFQGDVFGPYQIPNTGCNEDSIASQARDAMLQDGGNPSEYRQFMYVFPSAGCGWGGLAMLGQPQNPAEDSWYNGSFNCVVRNQEVAHNYGLLHTHFYQCGGGVPFASNCGAEEYGSPYDPMGYGCGHMAAPDKEYMGWLEGCNVVSATSDGTYNLVPSEVPCNGTQALKLPTFDGRDYYLEYRQPIGFDVDEGTDGVLVHVSGEADFFGPDAYLIDLGEGAFMAPGQSYSDPQGTVTFTFAEQHETHAVIEVDFPDGASGDPTCLGGGSPEQQAGVWGTLQCSGGPFVPDVVPPTVSITDPVDGQEFAPDSTFTVIVDAQDDTGSVNSVALFLDDEAPATRTEPPWEWEINNLPLGTHTLFATASDGINEATSASISIEITENPTNDTGDSGDGDGDSGDGDGDGGSEGDGGSGEDDGGSDDGALPPGFGGDEQGACACRSDSKLPSAGWLLMLVVLFRRRRA